MANKAQHFHQEAALTQAGEVKKHGKGGEQSKFLISVSCLAQGKKTLLAQGVSLSRKEQSN